MDIEFDRHTIPGTYFDIVCGSNGGYLSIPVEFPLDAYYDGIGHMYTRRYREFDYEELEELDRTYEEVRQCLKYMLPRHKRKKRN